MSIQGDDMTNDRESFRLILAELWVRELLAIVEAAAAGLDVRNAAKQLLARIDALETPERPARSKPESGASTSAHTVVDAPEVPYGTAACDAPG